MFLISLKSGKFSKKDKNPKVGYGEYQYVSTPTLTMYEFDPAFLAFIRCRILSHNLWHCFQTHNFKKLKTQMVKKKHKIQIVTKHKNWKRGKTQKLKL